MPPGTRATGPGEPEPPDLPAELETLATARSWDGGLESVLARRIDPTGANLALLRVRQARLDQITFDDSAMAGASLEDVVVSGGSWANARATGSVLRRLAFDGVRLTGADFSSGRLRDVRFRRCRA